MFCYISPFVDYGDILDKTVAFLRPLKSAKLYRVESMIQQMSPSPDGKLLALAAGKGLYVWDVTKETFVFSDDVISARRVRFSPSGKYLAVAGNGIPEGNSDIIVYETDGFKRIDAIRM
jgi:WD40 repeat protein